MPLLSSVQPSRRIGPLLVSSLLVLLLVPTWSGAVRLPLPEGVAEFGISPRPISQRRFGALDLVGVVTVKSRDPAFGGFSAMALRRGRVTLQDDGGNWVGFAIRHGQAVARSQGALRQGPGTGWEKKDRDSESMTFAGDHAWIGFERANEIWRYDAGLSVAQERARPAAMRRWAVNGGAESLTRLPDGRFLVIAETARGTRPRAALLFSGDPTAPASRVARMAYRPPAGFNPVDAAALPSGDVLILNRRFRLPFDFTAKLVLVPRLAIRAGAVMRGREIATIGGPLAENWEALAVTRDARGTAIWLANDNDASFWRRSMLAKFWWRAPR